MGTTRRACTLGLLTATIGLGTTAVAVAAAPDSATTSTTSTTTTNSSSPTGPGLTATRSTPAYKLADTTVSIDGTSLTVTSTNPKFLASVQGHHIYGMCMFGIPLLTAGNPTGPLDYGVVGNAAAWAVGAQSVVLTLPRDESAAADICELGTLTRSLVPPPAAIGAFTSAGLTMARQDTASGLTSSQEAKAAAAFAAEQQLRVAYGAAQVAAAHSPSGTFAPGQQLRTAINASRPKLKIAYAATLAGVRRDGVVYVVGAGTVARTLELAERDRYGKLHVLRAKPGLVATVDRIPV